MNKRLFIPLAFLILLIGGGGYFWLHAQGGNGAERNAGPGAPPPSQPVAVMVVEKQKAAFSHTLPGRISAYRQSQVRPQVDGIITERLFNEGEYVEKGQQLYQIDDRRYKAALNSALADVQSAKANVEAIASRAKRYEELVKIDAVSQQEYDDIKAQLDQAKAAVAIAEAAVDMAQVNLDYTKVYAPISGRIGRSIVTEGALVTANQDQHLAVITQLDPVYIDMQQSGAEAIELRSRIAGREEIPVRLTLNEETNKVYAQTGTLKFSGVTIDETTGAIALRALMPNPEGILLPGLFVRATLDLGEHEVLLVPQRASTRMPDGSVTIWIVDENNQAQPITIKVEQAYNSSWVVSDGLKPGDKVIVEGYQKVGPGMSVVASPWMPEGSAPPPTAEKSKG